MVSREGFCDMGYRYLDMRCMCGRREGGMPAAGSLRGGWFMVVVVAAQTDMREL